MERTLKTLTISDVAGWGSALVTFGLIQGAFYLKAYWGHFGLDPFQFVAVSELALAGLAGIGMVLFFMLVALLLGGWFEDKLTTDTSKASPIKWWVLVLFLLGMLALMWWSNGWPLLIGAALVGICAVVVRMSPVLPESVRDSPLLVYVLAMLVYVSFSSNWLGSERARKITTEGSEYTATVATDGKVQDGLSLVGRLGDSYVLWDRARKLAILVPVDDVRRLEVARRPFIACKCGRAVTRKIYRDQ